MGVYELIKGDAERGMSDLKNTSLEIEDKDKDKDVESAFEKLNSPSKSGADRGRILRRGNGRLVSLDVFRGLTVALMILVDDAGGFWPAINHSPWNGLTLADFVMPFFLFIVGVSLGLAYKNLSSRVDATKKAIFRALKLLVFGLFLQGGYFHGLNNLTYGVDIEQIRWMGTLQRIAIAYLLAAVCEIWLKGNDKVNSGLSLLKKYRFQWSKGRALGDN